MDSTCVTFRGEQVLVWFVDHGYESDTNAHEIEWWLAGPEFKDVELTDAEEEAIEAHVREIANDPHRHDDDDHFYLDPNP